MGKKPKRVMRFRITLKGVDPPIWRLIDVPETYTFWDLHVAIQDSMGWLDCHLHSFNAPRRYGRVPFRIGIAHDEFDDESLAGWEVPITSVFADVGATMEYEYDFGDSWFREVILVGILLKEPALKYPLCVDGRRACPPEDCGGIPGFDELLEILSDPSHEERAGMVEWLKGHAMNYWPYDPDKFDPSAVKFDSPRRRFRIAFSQR